jgi:hypothetical protein
VTKGQKTQYSQMLTDHAQATTSTKYGIEQSTTTLETTKGFSSRPFPLEFKTLVCKSKSDLVEFPTFGG